MTTAEGPTMFRMDDIGFGTATVPYYYSDGTSMAVPMVVGIAALLGSKEGVNGERLYDVEEVVARIKGGVNREKAEENGLTDKSVSQGTIDAAAAFDDAKVVPVLNNLTEAGNTVTISGYFFGNQGTITVGGTPAVATKWTQEEITLTIPEGAKGLQEVKIITSDGRYGRNYFKFTSGVVGYRMLTAPRLEYGELQGFPMTSADAVPTGIATAGNKIIYEGKFSDMAQSFMEIYDIDKDTWSKFETPKEMGLTRACSMAGGVSKIYICGRNEPGNTLLGVYDTVKEVFTKTATELNGTETLVVYQEQLLAVGGSDQSGDMATVKVVNPDTGKIMGSLPELPQGRSSVKIFAIGDTLILYGGLSEGSTQTDTMTFDGTSWTRNQASFYSAIDADPEQTWGLAMAPVNTGLIAVGPVKNLAQEEMVDTWSFDKGLDTWSGRNDVLYSPIKTVSNIGISNQGQLYVLGYTGMGDEPLVFRALEVDYQGPAQDAKGEGEPTPTPTLTPTLTPVTSKKVNAVVTGDTLPAGLLLVMILAGAVVSGYIVKRRRV